MQTPLHRRYDDRAAFLGSATGIVQQYLLNDP